MRLPFVSRKRYEKHEEDHRVVVKSLGYFVERVSQLRNERFLLKEELAMLEESVLRKNLGEAINIIIDYQRTLWRLRSPDPNIARANLLTSRWGVQSERSSDSYTILYAADDGNVYDLTFPITNANADEQRKRQVTDPAVVERVQAARGTESRSDK